MRQHGLDLAARQLAQQRVEKHHALGGPEAGEVGIRVGRALAAIHHEQAFRREPAALHQRLHARLQRFVGERFELVEQRRDHGRVEHEDQQVGAHPRGPCPQPPQAAGGAHDPQHQCGDRQADQRADEHALQRVGDVEPPGHAVEAEALFDAEGAVQLEGQVENAADQREASQQRKLIGHVAEARLQRIAQHDVEHVDATEQRPAQQHGGAERHAQQPDAALRQRVVRSALVRGKRDGVGEGWRHAVTVRGHVAHLPRREPELDEQRGEQGCGEGEGQGLHGAEV